MESSKQTAHQARFSVNKNNKDAPQSKYLKDIKANNLLTIQNDIPTQDRILELLTEFLNKVEDLDESRKNKFAKPKLRGMIRGLIRDTIKETEMMNHARPKSDDSLTFSYNTFGSFDIA